MTPSAEAAVVVDDAVKTFILPGERRDTLKERAMHAFRRASSERLEALKGVTFDVKAGEFFGIVGRNGSGKSTLLKCLAGIYRLDGGHIHVAGRISPFIELGVGFHEELAAVDNIVLNGVMLGLTPEQARARVPEVLAFAELEQFTELKLKNYSSGMRVRLAFSVMVQVDADVLLIDEILAVGDAAFQQKCFDAFFRMRDEGKTIVFVTHDMGAVQRFCHRAVLIDRGQVIELGAPRDVADRYLRINFDRDEPDDPDAFGAYRGGDGAARIFELWTEDAAGERQSSFLQGSTTRVRARVKFDRAVEDPQFEVAFISPQLENVFIGASASASENTGRFEAGETAMFTVEFENALAPGRYALSTLIARPGGGTDVVDRWENITTIIVSGARSSGGIVDLPHRATIERPA